LALARASNEPNAIVTALLGLSDIASSFADFAEGERLAREGLALCRQLQRPDLMARVVASLAWATNCQGNYAESERYYRESLAIAKTVGNPFSIGVATQFLGWVAYCQGGEHLAEALARYEASIAIFRQIGHGNHLAMALGDYALAANEAGKHHEAHTAASEGLALAEALAHHTQVGYNLNGLGGAMCGLGDLPSARQHLLRSLQISSAAHSPDHAGLTLYLFTNLLRKESNLADLSPAQQQQKLVLALTVLTFIQQPTTWQPVQDRAARAQAELAATLPSGVAAAASAQGRRHTLAEIVALVRT